MTTLEIILSACLLGLSVACYGETLLRREAVAGWNSCIGRLLYRSHQNSELEQQNHTLRVRVIELAMRNEDLENQVSAMTSRRYERN